jgi:hypothetical protein
MGKAKGKRKRQAKGDDSDMLWMGHGHTGWGGLQLTVCSSVRSWVMNCQ